MVTQLFAMSNVVTKDNRFSREYITLGVDSLGMLAVGAQSLPGSRGSPARWPCSSKLC